eukprot:UN12485
MFNKLFGAQEVKKEPTVNVGQANERLSTQIENIEMRIKRT